MSGAAGLLLVAGLGAGLMLTSIGPVIGQQAAVVTTDTPEYCLSLLDRVSELVRAASTPPPAEVTSLSSAGQQMCNQGQTRGGIMRLRRALMILMHPDSPAPPP